jgi:preprotein translocase subunit SecY
MLQTLKNAWRTKDIRGKLLFTLLILLLYRIGTVIPVPFVDAHDFAGSFQGTILDYLNLLSGGSLGQATLFALGVSPYINSSIIIQLLAVVFPKLGELSKNDKKKMGLITRITTVILAVVTAIGYYFLLAGSALTPAATEGQGPNFWFYGIVIVVCYVAGASLVMWLADRINEHGIGNGVSMILFANIVTSLPQQCIAMYDLVRGTFAYEKPVGFAILAILFVIFLAAIVLAMTMFVIFITGSERRIPVQYAKRVVGRKMYGGQSSNLPIKLNMTGVMPVIFASSIVSLVPTILMLFQVKSTDDTFWGWLSRFLGSDGFVYPIVFFLLIIGFAYFYTQITFDPVDVANNLKKQGGAIPGIRQGRPTSDYIKKILNKITLAGALFLSVVAVLPVIAGPHLIQHIVEWILSGNSYYAAATVEAYAKSYSSIFTFGGTSLIIVVGVALETFRELEAQLTMRNYKGFL